MAIIEPSSQEYFNLLKEARAYYEKFEGEIIESTIRGKWLGAYSYDWVSLFSPAEYLVWAAIRYMGRIMLYPQHPVGKYYVDFGNPYYRIALEVDGKEFHVKEKDIIRDTDLFRLGWKVFRVTGSEANKTIDVSEIVYRNGNLENLDQDDYNTVRDYYLNTAEGVLDAIRAFYFKSQFDPSLEHFYLETLNNHKLIEFNL
jgi:very-short-patch-repair endonuclease